MTAAEQEAAAALRASMTINHGQQLLTEESRLLLAALLREEMREAVREGIADAMTEEAAERFWRAGLDVLQRRAQEKAGRFLLDGFLAAGKKLLWIGVIVLAAYSLGGWTLLKTIWTAITPKG